MKTNIRSHAPEEWLERYSMRRLTEGEAESLEDHLMFCQWCQTKLESVESFLFVAREASRRVREESLNARTSKTFWSRLSGLSLTSIFAADSRRGWYALPATAAAMACLALFFMIPPAQDAGYQQVRLEAVRGTETNSVSSRQPLEITLNLEGLTVSPAYRVEIVSSTGTRNTESLVEAKGNSLTLRVKSKLAPGQYWVRLYVPGTQNPIREFSLRSN
jgi:methionine-rich copper-binding protein CopC